MAKQPQARLFTVEEYHRMADAGILGEDLRVELVNGMVVQMTAIGSRHGAGVKRLNALFSARFADRAIVQVQDPVRLSDLSEPQPDVVLLRPKANFYADANPTPAEAILVVEVADSTLDFDLSVKAPLYCAAGVDELWIVDIEAQELVVYRNPGPHGYADVQRLAAGAQVAPIAFPDEVLRLSDLLG